MHPVQEDLVPMPQSAESLCFGCSASNPVGLRLSFFLSPDRSVVAYPTVSDEFTGMRGYLHGGILATLLDEAMSKSLRAHQISALTRQMEVNYLRPVPSQRRLRLEGRLLRSEGRKHWSEARILDERGHTLAESTGLFVEVHRQRSS